MAASAIHDRNGESGVNEHDDTTDLDLRKFGQLTPLEQLDRLESDFRTIDSYEKCMRAANAKLNSSKSKEITP